MSISKLTQHVAYQTYKVQSRRTVHRLVYPSADIFFKSPASRWPRGILAVLYSAPGLFTSKQCSFAANSLKMVYEWLNLMVLRVLSCGTWSVRLYNGLVSERHEHLSTRKLWLDRLYVELLLRWLVSPSTHNNIKRNKDSYNYFYILRVLYH